MSRVAEVEEPSWENVAATVADIQDVMKVLTGQKTLAELEAQWGQTATASCKKHPKYQAKRPPRCECPTCWQIWDQLHPAVAA